jgi:hypothetical protein
MTAPSNRGDAFVDIGEELARAMMPLIHSAETGLNEEQKLLMWAGLFAAFGGAAAASIGSGALEAVQQITKRLTATVVKKNTQ